MEIFKLPDLGEGLPDAEIVEWHVKQGDYVGADEALVSMETAKAVVDVPSPISGIIVKMHGETGDVIKTGAALATFDTGEDRTIRPADDIAPDFKSRPPVKPVQSLDGDGAASDSTGRARADSSTVVGQMPAGDSILREQTFQVGEFKASPAVRATARKLKVDLTQVRGSGRDGVITVQDVKAAASAMDGDPVADRYPNQSAPAAAPATLTAATLTPAVPAPAAPAEPDAPANIPASGEWTLVRGPRRTMARVMAEAHAAVVPTSITERADLALWEGKQDITVRLIRALVAACRAEPVLNAWFNPDGPQIQLHQHVDVGIAVDTPDGLFVSNLRQADQKDARQLREDLNQLRDNVKNRSIPPADLTGYSIMLSNVGIYAGRYTTPIIMPPCVAIMAIGKLRDEAVPTFAGVSAHPMLPLSLTFDHRAVTGGEAARFLVAFIDDLTRAG